MAKRKLRRVQFRRKKEGKTDYRKRLKLLISNKPRLVIRKFLGNIVVQVINYSEKGDSVVVGVHSSKLDKFGWKTSKGSVPAAYLTGFLAGKAAAKKDVKDCVLDLGLARSSKGSRLYAAAKGFLDSGMKLKCSKEVLPGEDRVSGKHIEECAKKLKEKSEEGYKKKFSKYIKNGVEPEGFSKHFKEVKEKITKED